MTIIDIPQVQTELNDLLMLPRGFRFASQRCGIKHSGADLGLLLADKPATAAGCMTRNKVRAPCVDRNESALPSASVRALIVNSGNANAMTGASGVEANDRMALAGAHALSCPPEHVLTASTGAIGVPLAIELIEEAAPSLVSSADRDPRGFAEAILTTDTCTKLAQLEFTVPGSSTPIRLLGIAKGSGMIHPNMATTFGFVVTDARVAATRLSALLQEAVDESFNQITVDGDTSTNDMVIALSSGASEVAVEGAELEAAFGRALTAVLQALAKQVARDGEGATRLLEVEVTGAASKADARTLAKGVCRSSLVKCSAFAAQPEWGRVGMAIGQLALERNLSVRAEALTIGAQDTTLYDSGEPKVGHNAATLRAGLQQAVVRWTIDLGQGDARALAWGCDMSYDYVRINADESKQIAATRSGGISRNHTLTAYSPRLKHQLLCEGLSYVRRFTGLRAMIYVSRIDALKLPFEALARDLELCLDAGLKPLAVLPDEEAVQAICSHMQHAGRFAASVAADPVTVGDALDRGHLGVIVRPSAGPDAVVELALKLGIHKLVALGSEVGIVDKHGLVQRISPDSFLTGLERGRFDSTEPELLVLARHAAKRGVPAFHAVDGRIAHAVVGELFTDEGIGTLITRQALA